MKIYKKWLLVAACCLGAQQAHAIPVDLELVLLNDVSGNVSAAEFALQRAGYEAVFRNTNIIAAIESGAIGTIAVTLVDWSERQSEAVPWTLISDSASSNSFADAIARALRPTNIGSSTEMAAAMNFATNNIVLPDNNLEGTRIVLDVSGHGGGCGAGELVCSDVQNERNEALDAGVDTINALWIDDLNLFGDDRDDAINALEFGNRNVLGGDSPFQLIAQDFDEFGSVIEAKILREITGDPLNEVPEPGMLALLGAGLVNLSLLRRRRKDSQIV